LLLADIILHILTFLLQSSIYISAVTADIITTLKEQYKNLGLRILVETTLKNLVTMHLEGQCPDPVCGTFMSGWEQRNIIRKKHFARKLSTPSQVYSLLKQDWRLFNTLPSGKAEIAHFSRMASPAGYHKLDFHQARCLLF
jgi:hypothetical protein